MSEVRSFSITPQTDPLMRVWNYVSCESLHGSFRSLLFTVEAFIQEDLNLGLFLSRVHTDTFLLFEFHFSNGHLQKVHHT